MGRPVPVRVRPSAPSTRADVSPLRHPPRFVALALVIVTVFGKVVKGMEVVDAIAGVPTGMKSGMSDVPRETVTITSAKATK